MTRRFSLLLSLLLAASLLTSAAAAQPAAGFELKSRAAVLMDPRSGQILLSHNASEPLAPASITKIMTLALVCEAVAAGRASWDDDVAASELAASLGGSQIWLVAGERMTLRHLALAIGIASANDAAVAAAEHISGSHDQFVALMNERAQQLGMTTATFANAHGLDEPGHELSALDAAIMSRWAITVPGVLELTSMWEEYIRDGESWLVNTNRLLKTVPGVDGLKTGSTDNAKFCVSATAQRDSTRMLAVIMAGPDSATRFEEARQLLNYGFANYHTVGLLTPGQVVTSLSVHKGRALAVDVVAEEELAITLPKGQQLESSVTLDLPDAVEAPVQRGLRLGRAVIVVDGDSREVGLLAAEDVPRANLGQLLARVLKTIAQRFR